MYHGFEAHCDETFGLLMVFHFTGAHKSDMLAKVLQALIDTSLARFSVFPDVYNDVETNLQTYLIDFERAEHT